MKREEMDLELRISANVANIKTIHLVATFGNMCKTIKTKAAENPL